MISSLTDNRFTLRDLFVVVTIIAVLCSSLFPWIAKAREEARRVDCSNNMKQLGLAILNYEGTYKCYPALASGTGGTDPESCNFERRGPILAMVTFIEATSLYSEFAHGFPVATRSGRIIPQGPAPWITLDGGYTPWRHQFPTLRCPSDPGKMNISDPYDIARSNYAFCMGDTCEGANWKWSKTANRGAFQASFNRKVRDIADGTSNTIFLAEVGTDSGPISVRGWVANGIPGIDQTPSNCLATAMQDFYLAKFSKQAGNWRGLRWTDGAPAYSGFNTILPPNSPSCSPHPFPNDWDWGIYSATSYHLGGVHVCMGDSSVEFVSNKIDAGNSNNRAPRYENRTKPGESVIKGSPFGVWGARGTYAGEDFLPADR